MVFAPLESFTGQSFSNGVRFSCVAAEAFEAAAASTAVVSTATDCAAVKTPLPKTSNTGARLSVIFWCAAASVSAATSTASAAVALMPFEISLGCLPAKGESRNYVIEWLGRRVDIFDGRSDLLGHCNQLLYSS
jgi:hypothetical protein